MQRRVAGELFDVRRTIYVAVLLLSRQNVMLKLSRANQRMRPGPVYAALFVVSLSATAAAADTRDQVETGAARCAVIGDDRQWLDCYYGAAQPLRAELRLTPATDAQLTLVAHPPAGTPAAGSEATRNIVLRNAFSCGMDEDQKSWLNCFYAATEPMRVHLGLTSLLRDGGTGASSVTITPAKSGLGEERRTKSAPPARAVTARMASYTFNNRGIFTVKLDNGQVWQQLASDDSFAHWHAAPDRLFVKVSKGFWGSYNLEVSGHSGMYKVRRIE